MGVFRLKSYACCAVSIMVVKACARMIGFSVQSV